MSKDQDKEQKAVTDVPELAQGAEIQSEKVVAPKSAEERAKLGSEVERGNLKDAVEEKKAEEAINPAVIESLASREEADRLGDKAIKWNPFSEAGLEELKKDLSEMGYGSGNPAVFEMHFRELRKTFEAKDRKLEEKYYKNPNLYIDALREQDKNFYDAWMFYEALKGQFEAAKRMHSELEENIKKQTGFPKLNRLWDGGVDFLRGILKDKNQGNYPSFIGKCLVAGTASFVALKLLFRQFGPKQTKLEMLICGAGGLFITHEILKRNGVDVFKKIGVKDSFEEVKGTEMEALAALGGKKSEGIDGRWFLESGLLHMGTLHDKYAQAKARVARGQEGYIDPAQFADNLIFKEFAGMTPDKDFNKDENYTKAAKDLYRIMEIIEAAYERDGNDMDTAMNDPQMREMQMVDFTGRVLAAHHKPGTMPTSVKKGWDKSTQVASAGLRGAKNGVVGAAKVVGRKATESAQWAVEKAGKAKDAAKEKFQGNNDPFFSG